MLKLIQLKVDHEKNDGQFVKTRSVAVLNAKSFHFQLFIFFSKKKPVSADSWY